MIGLFLRYLIDYLEKVLFATNKVILRSKLGSQFIDSYADGIDAWDQKCYKIDFIRNLFAESAGLLSDVICVFILTLNFELKIWKKILFNDYL